MSEQNLVQTIISLENYEEAAEALLQMREINPDKAAELAKDIIENKKGDVFFQATALELLYLLDFKYICNFIITHINTVDIYLLGTIIESVTEDSAIVEGNNDLKKIIEAIKSYLKSNDEKYFIKIKHSVDWFFETYGR
jgi:hypothetical protein